MQFRQFVSPGRENDLCSPPKAAIDRMYVSLVLIFLLSWVRPLTKRRAPACMVGPTSTGHTSRDDVALVDVGHVCGEGAAYL